MLTRIPYRRRRWSWFFTLCIALSLAGWCCAAPSKSKKRHRAMFKTDGPAIPRGEDVIRLSGGGSIGLRMLSVTCRDDLGETHTADMVVWYPTRDKEHAFTYDYFKNRVQTSLSRDGAVADGAHPLMIQFGEKEVAFKGNDRENIYNLLRCPKYMLAIAGGGHGSFSGGLRKEYATLAEYTQKDTARAAVARYVVAFFGYYLRGDKMAAKQLAVRGDHISGYISSEFPPPK